MHRTPLIALGSAVLILGTLTPAAAHADTITLTGTVTAGGVGVGDVDVDFGNQDTTTNADGTFAFELDTASVSTGWIRVGGTDRSGTFTAGDGTTYATAVVGAGGAQAASAGLVQPVTAGELPTLPAINVHLGSTGSISGGNSTLAGAYISLFDAAQNNAGGDENPGKDGAYSFAGLAPGKYWVRVEGDNRSDTASIVTVQAGQNTVYSPTLKSLATLRGTVTVAHKAPKAAVVVEAARAGQARDSATAKTGKYSLSGLAAGGYTASYGTYGTGSTISAGKWIPKSVKATLKAGATTVKNVDLAVGGTIAISVKKPAGAKSIVYSVRKGAKTVAQGQVTFGKKSTVSATAPGLATGRYSLAVASSTGGLAVKTVSVTAKKTSHVAVTAFPKKALTLSGTVPGLSSGKVYVFTKDAGNSWAVTAPIHANGTYSITGLVPNVYSAWAYGPKHDALDAVTVKLTSSKKLTIAAAPESGAITGALSLDGVPVTDADVYLTSSSGDTVYTGVDEHGQLTTDTALPPGTYSISSVLHSDSVPIPRPYWLAGSGSFTVKAGQTTDLGTVALQVHGG